jgi:hypothetical protein
MEPSALFLFYYYRELARNALTRERLEAEHRPDHSGVFARPQLEPVRDPTAADLAPAGVRPPLAFRPRGRRP